MIKTLCNLLIFLLLIIFPNALAYSANPSQDYSISSFSVADGLSQSTVYSILQDSEGFIWLGTRAGGLNRFDGYNFEIFMHSSVDSTSLSHNEVISIFEDSQKNLWVGTTGGALNRFDRDKRNFIRYPLNSSETIAVRCMYEDEANTLFLGTDRGLYGKARGSDEFRLFNPDFDKSMEIVSIVGLDENTLILGTTSGIYKLIKNTGELIMLFEIFPDPSFGITFHVPLLIDKKNNLWFGTPQGMYLFVDEEMERTVKNPFGIEILENHHVRTLHEDQNGKVWIGLPNGLLELNPKTGDYSIFQKRSNDPNSLSHNSIRSFFEDKDGNFWVGTWGGGVTFFGSLTPKFKHFFHIPDNNSISDNIVSSFAEAENGMWIGIEGGGVNFYRFATGSFTSFQDEANLKLSTNHIKTLYTDSQGMLWIGTWGEGVYRYNPNTRRYKHLLSDTRVYSFCEYPQGQMWVGTINGLFRINNKDDVMALYPENGNNKGLHDIFITSIFNDSRGDLWVGTQTGGLHLYNELKDEFINFRSQPGNSQSIIDNYIICITEHPTGELWIGTNSGICRYDHENGIFRDMTSKINPPSKVINGIVLDGESNFWISTNKGLTMYDIGTGESLNYDVRDGLQSNEFNRGAFFKSSSNDIFFGGINGFNSFNPSEFQYNTVLPKVVITDLKLFGNPVMPDDDTGILQKRISETREIVLDYKQSIFSFNFVALNYLAPDKNRYKYKLEGYSNDWVDLGHQKSVSFMNLPYGKYTFRVIAANNDNVWNETGVYLDITILPSPWRTNLAYFVYFIILSLMVFFLHYFISSRLKERNQIYNEKLERERIEELNQMKIRFFTNITHELKTPLTLITAPLDNLVSDNISKEKKDYYYKLIKGNVTRLKSLGNQLIDFRRAEQEYYKLRVKQGSLKEFVFKVSESFAEMAEHKRINFLVDCVDHNNTGQWFDPEILEKILFNLLSNAFKFTPDGGDIRLMMRLTKNLTTLSVKDTGIGISPEELPFVFDRFFTSKIPEKSNYTGTGIGLSFTKMLTEVHHGSIEVTSQKENYTEFSLTIPIDSESYSGEEQEVSPGVNKLEKPGDSVYIEPVSANLTDDEEISELAELMLVVEDNDEIAQYLVNQFSDDFKVYRATNGQEGFEMARELIPDIIVSDIMMDKMTGLELCTKVKNDIITTHIPVVLLTVLISNDSKIDGLEVGADAYVEKPFEIKYLRTVVNNLLKQRAAMKEKYLLENINLAGGAGNKTDSKFLAKVEEIVESHYSDPDFSIVTLSEKLNVSRSQLFRKFKSVTGKSPSDFLRVVRLKKAAEIILQGDLGINEVAYEVGFVSPSHFISRFKKYFGKTPKEYAQKKN